MNEPDNTNPASPLNPDLEEILDWSGCDLSNPLEPIPSPQPKAKGEETTVPAANTPPNESAEPKKGGEWTSMRVRKRTVEMAKLASRRFGCSMGDVVHSAVDILPDAILGMERYTWLYLDQTLNRLEETLAYNVVLRESLEDLLFELVQAEKELSFNLEDLNNTVYAAEKEDSKKEGHKLDE